MVIFNEAATLLGKPLVKKWADTKTAQRRTAAILAEVPAKSAPIEAEKPAKKASEPKAKKPKRAETGVLVGPDTYRAKLIAVFERNEGKNISVTRLMEAVYGEARKDYKQPLMMVMKGVKMVYAKNGIKKTIEKTRIDKENYFGLFEK